MEYVVIYVLNSLYKFLVYFVVSVWYTLLPPAHVLDKP